MAAFVLVCAPKGLEVGDDHKLHRASQARELQQELTAVLEPMHELTAASGCALQFKDGGALAAIGAPDVVSVASMGDRIAAFQGTLKNIEQLCYKYGPALPTSPTPISPPIASPPPPGPSTGGSTGSNGVAAASPTPKMDDVVAPAAAASPVTASDAADVKEPGASCMNPAEVILAMYEVEGVSLLAKLQGKFAFVMYDAKQMRVLAARDGSGAVPLLQARTSRDGLVLASHAPMLACCHDTLEFSPGFFKYGWHAEPRLFTPSDILVAPAYSSRRSMDHHNPHAPHAQGRRSSLDIHAGKGHAGHPPAHPTQARPVSGRPHEGHAHPIHAGSPARNNGGGVPVPARSKRSSLDHGSPARNSWGAGSTTPTERRTPGSSGAHGSRTPGGSVNSHGNNSHASPHRAMGSPAITKGMTSTAHRPSPPTQPTSAHRTGRRSSGGGGNAGTTACAQGAVESHGHLNANAKAFVPSAASQLTT